MNCEEFYELLEKLDSKQKPSQEMLHHMNKCDKCSRLAGINNYVNNELAQSSSYASAILPSAIMHNILLTEGQSAQETPIRPWLFAGLIILIGVFVSGNSNDFSWMKSNAGGNFEIIFDSMFGIFISIYIFIFVLTHMKKAKSIIKHEGLKTTLYR